MANVTLDITVENAQQLYDQLYAEKRRLLDLLDGVNYNLDALADAIRRERTQETLVMSEHNPWKSYVVKATSGVYSCSCPSYEFSNGLDSDGHCKHIRKVIDEGRFA